MSDINLDEFLLNDSIFERIQSLSPFPFFDTLAPLEMDKMLKSKYGDRLVFSKYIKTSLDTLALFIVSEYQTKWENILATLNVDFKNGSERVLIEDTENNMTNVGNNLTENKVSAYNDDELVIDKADNNTSSSESENKILKNTTEKLTSYATVYNNLSLTQKLNIINTVVNDVAKHLTLDIYK